MVVFINVATTVIKGGGVGHCSVSRNNEYIQYKLILRDVWAPANKLKLQTVTSVITEDALQVRPEK